MGIELFFLCLALNIYYEARGESYEGQIAVSHVVLNRARIKKRGICEEIYSPYQFSWTHQFHLPPPPSSPSWVEAQINAQRTYSEKDPTGGALWYHHKGITPWWIWNKEVSAVIDNHIFYKCKKGYTCDWN